MKFFDNLIYKVAGRKQSAKTKPFGSCVKYQP